MPSLTVLKIGPVTWPVNFTVLKEFTGKDKSKLKHDVGLEKLGLGQFFDQTGIKMNFAEWAGNLVKWFLVLQRCCNAPGQSVPLVGYYWRHRFAPWRKLLPKSFH